ncbi:hypothetical protein Tco_0379390 [Tanacetum coccineum]
MGKELERGNFPDSLLWMVLHFECLSKKSVDEGFRMPKRGQHEEISHVETLDCSVVKLATSPRRPTTSRRKSCTSSSSLSILCDIVRGCRASGVVEVPVLVLVLVLVRESLERPPQQPDLPHLGGQTLKIQYMNPVNRSAPDGLEPLLITVYNTWGISIDLVSEPWVPLISSG